MSVVTRINRGRNKSVSTTAIAVVLGLFVLLFLVRYGQELLLEHDLNDRTAVQLRTNAALRDENTRFKASLQYYQSEKYIEQRAREDLNLRRSDEEVLVPTGFSAADAPKGATPPAPAATGGVDKQNEGTNWEGWLGLFAPVRPADPSP